MIDLGSERLSLTRAFGSDIESRLNDQNDFNPAVVAAREHLLGGNTRHIVGSAIAEGDPSNKVIQTIKSQMGVPDNFSTGSLSDRFGGREKDFLTVVLGFKNLSLLERVKLIWELRQIGIKYVLDE